MLSVITPSIRKDGLKIVRDSLSKQTLRDFEWLIGGSFDFKISNAIHVVDNFRGGFWTLNRVYNKLIQQARGELVVSWQDNIYIPPDGLEKFWINYQKTKGIVSGVGDQYESVDKWGCPQIKIWSDPRKSNKYGSFYEINPEDCEWNWCAVPREAFFRVGGFDEQLDFLGYGMDGYQVNERLDKLGYKFFIDQTNESFTVRHGRERRDWDQNNLVSNGKYQERKIELIKRGSWPVLDYLNSP